MLPKRLVAHGVAVLAVLGSGVGAAVVGTGASSVVLAGPQALRLIRSAPAALESFPSLSMQIEFTFSGNGQSLTSHESALTTRDGKTGTFSIQLPNDLGKLEARAVDGTVYAAAPADHYPATQGVHWVGLKVHERDQSGLQTPTGGDALSYLRLLPGATGEVRDYGDEDINGVNTRHYQVAVDLVKAAAAVPPELRTGSVAELEQLGLHTIPYDVWLDADNAVRRIAFTIAAAGIEVTGRVDISGSNEPVHVAQPARADTFFVDDAQQFIQMALGGCC